MPTATAGGMHHNKTCNRKRPREFQNSNAVTETSGADTRSKQVKNNAYSGSALLIVTALAPFRKRRDKGWNRGAGCGVQE